MNINYITNKYNWASFSTSRSAYETLKTYGYNINLYQDKPPIPEKYLKNGCIWLMASARNLTKKQFEHTNEFVVSFGLSDPLRFNEDCLKTCDLYCSNDLTISKEYGCYWFPTSCNIKHHKYLNIEKEYDVLFFGTGVHPKIPERIKIVKKIRDAGISIKVFGGGWPKHKNNFGFVGGNKLIKQINKARMVLDIGNINSPLARRVFESSACSTPVLTVRRSDITALFNEGTEILCYSCVDELIDTIKLYIKNKNKLIKIGKYARLRCIKEHNITCRIDKLLNHIKNIR